MTTFMYNSLLRLSGLIGLIFNNNNNVEDDDMLSKNDLLFDISVSCRLNNTICRRYK